MFNGLKVLFRPIYLALAGFFVFILIALFLLRSPYLFPISSVVVKGDIPNISEDTIKFIVKPFAEKGFFGSNISGLQDKLEALPWISKASVARIWPNKLSIILVQKKSIAIWNHRGVVISTGEVFYPESASLPKELPEFNGPEGRLDDMLQVYQKMLLIIKPTSFAVTALDLSPKGDWRLVLNNKTTLALGDEAIYERLQRFLNAEKKVYEKENRYPAYVDMRYSHGMSVKY